ncbi:MAG: branched-chain amino acid ABC transporter permease [Atribacterota bacterium]|nr:branched-chain amino acid ABC transporter permease [Atribacterota bacterium]
MNIYIAQTINGIALGSIYVLLVTGFNLMFSVGKIIHFAYPFIVVISMYVCWGLLKLTSNLLVAVLGAVVSSFFLHVIIEPIFHHINTRKKSVDINSSFIISMGISLILTEIMSQHINYGFPVSFPLNWLNSLRFFEILQIRVSSGQLYTLLTSIFITFGLFFLINKTQTGRTFRAIAENITTARIQGIPIIKMNLFLYGFAGILGGIIAIMFTILIGSASPWLGEYMALKVLALAIVAGIGNMRAGLIFGFILGVTESMIIHFFPGSWSNALIFIIMLIVVLIKPQGVLKI